MEYMINCYCLYPLKVRVYRMLVCPNRKHLVGQGTSINDYFQSFQSIRAKVLHVPYISSQIYTHLHIHTHAPIIKR